eukprot:6687625-Prorocentrum_lima.AAC.1
MPTTLPTARICPPGGGGLLHGVPSLSGKDHPTLDDAVPGGNGHRKHSPSSKHLSCACFLSTSRELMITAGA